MAEQQSARVDGGVFLLDSEEQRTNNSCQPSAESTDKSLIQPTENRSNLILRRRSLSSYLCIWSAGGGGEHWLSVQRRSAAAFSGVQRRSAAVSREAAEV
ncbi:uncharacterized protein V6R79_020460 [Siganus canaliculatus]